MANLPISTLEESTPNANPNGGRIVAIRRAGSDAPVSAGGHNPRPSWPCVYEAQTENSLLEGGRISQEYEA
jgi:hypothetical protein